MSKYRDAAIKARQYSSAKVRTALNKNVRDNGKLFVQLVESIPHWETYLTEKQLEVVHLYLKLLSTSEVDYQLRLTEGTTYHRLFGTPSLRTEGAFGTLKRVRRLLDQKEKQLKQLAE